MAGYYKGRQGKQEKSSTVAGIVLATVLHIALFTVGALNGLKYLYPPPPEQSMLVEFLEVSGVGEVKAERYGQMFLDAIAAYQQEH